MLPSAGVLLPRRLVSSVFIFVLIFYAFRSSLISSPFSPAFPDLELAVILRCLAYIIFLTPSVLFQGFDLFVISSPFNCLLTHLPSTILFLCAFISLFLKFLTLSCSISPRMKSLMVEKQYCLIRPLDAFVLMLPSVKSFWHTFLPVNTIIDLRNLVNK